MGSQGKELLPPKPHGLNWSEESLVKYVATLDATENYVRIQELQTKATIEVARLQYEEPARHNKNKEIVVSLIPSGWVVAILLLVGVSLMILPISDIFKIILAAIIVLGSSEGIPKIIKSIWKSTK